MEQITIALDGPAGAGKSTIAKQIAHELNIIYVDTGAMYRAVAYYMLSNKIDMDIEEQVVQQLEKIHIQLQHKDGMQRILVNDEDVTTQIRIQSVAKGASQVAKIKEVRQKLVQMQKQIANEHSVVMDGRDIGTHVLPNATLKVFLTASVHERAVRRWEELKLKGIDCDFETIQKEIEDRDHADTTRSESPLIRAEDAVLIDTTSMTIDRVVQKVISLLRRETNVCL